MAQGEKTSAEVAPADAGNNTPWDELDKADETPTDSPEDTPEGDDSQVETNDKGDWSDLDAPTEKDELGDKGPQVQSLQLLLNGKGFPCSDDGSFGKETYDALTNFQTAAGILVDGECGGQSWAALANYRV